MRAPQVLLVTLLIAFACSNYTVYKSMEMLSPEGVAATMEIPDGRLEECLEVERNLRGSVLGYK